MDTTDSEQELKGLKRAKSLLAQTLIGFDNAEKDYGYDMANERYYVEQAIHEIDNDVNETPKGNGESSPLEGIVRLTKNDVPKNYLVKAAEKLTGKYYTPPEVLERIKQEDRVEPDFNAVIEG